MVELPTYVDTQTTLGTQQAEKTKIDFTSRSRKSFHSNRSKDESIEHQVKLIGKNLQTQTLKDNNNLNQSNLLIFLVKSSFFLYTEDN